MVAHLMNANGGEMFIYPAFILYHVSHEAFARVDIRDANLDYTPISFIEEEAIPTDAQLIGHTWRKPIRMDLQIGDLLTTAAQGFAQAWTQFKNALPTAIA